MAGVPRESVDRNEAKKWCMRKGKDLYVESAHVLSNVEVRADDWAVMKLTSLLALLALP